MKRVYVFGAGKVGRALAKALKRAGVPVTLRGARRGLPSRRIAADLLVLSVRDDQLPALARALATADILPPGVAVVHCAGALGAEVLAPLRSAGVVVAQMHPLVSVADSSAELSGGWLHVSGDAEAVARAKKLAKAIGMNALTIDGLDLALYHAATALLANGAVALVGAAQVALQQAGCPADKAAPLLAPLLASVASNVARLGLPGALTGPVRRGDAAAIDKHLTKLGERTPPIAGLYRALVEAQLPMARQLAEAAPENFDAIAHSLR